MIRILHIVGSVERAGIETFLINLYRNIDTSKYQFDFLIYNEPSKNSYYEEIRQRGGKVFLVQPKSKGIIKNYKNIKKIVKDNKYSVVWRNTDTCVGGIDLLAARDGGANIRILHAHSSRAIGINIPLHYLLRPFCNKLATHKFACGVKAGQWMFGSHPYETISNGINLGKFRFDQSIRNKYREKYGLKDNTVLGHIGRFDKVKNQSFLLTVFNEYKKAHSNSSLVLVGDGENFDKCHKLVEELGLSKDVLFLGVRNDIAELLQMMDVFVMPSLYEGFPVTLIEAQATGIPAVVSKCVPEETNVYGGVRFVGLKENISNWVDSIYECSNNRDVFGNQKMKEAGFDITDVVNKSLKCIDLLSYSTKEL